MQKVRQQKPKDTANSLQDKLENENFQILIYKLNKLEYFLEKVSVCEVIECTGPLLKAAQYFNVRAACLGLFASFNEDSISPDYYIQRITEYLDNSNSTEAITVANSKIFQTISKESLKDFLKMNKKNKIYKLNDKIEKFFAEKNFPEIINQLEEFAESHKLCFDDLNFKTRMYSHLVHSYFSLNQFDKCGYFCRKFLRQTIAYLNEQSNLSADTSETNADKIINKLDEFKLKKMTELFEFMSELLDLIHR